MNRRWHCHHAIGISVGLLIKTTPLPETRSLVYPEAHLCENKKKPGARRCKKELNLECLQKKSNLGGHTEMERTQLNVAYHRDRQCLILAM